MYCRTCGAPLGPQDVFCGVCGSKTGIVMSTNIGDHAESVLAAAKHQMMQGAPRSSDILAISSVLDAAQETEEGGTVLLEEPGGIIPGVNDQNQVENAGFRDRSMSLHTGSGSGSGSGSAGGAGGFSFGREANADTIPGLWEEWKVKERIGQGSFGSGYRIEKQDFGRSVFSALKVISVPQNQADIDSLYSEGMSEAEISHYYTDAVQKIVDEFDLMSQLRGHSNIVSYEDHKVIPKPGGIGYDILIRMELLKPFNQYLRENGNEIGRMEVLRLGVDMCKALEACETMHVIHRDIKPENIFVHHLGSFKLGDFGVAREMERTMTVMSKKGTYSYMAPEVYAGKEYDRTVDLYSLGIMLYRYFNGGRLPFVERTGNVSSEYRQNAMMRRIKGEPLPAPAQADPELSAVILKACAPAARDRFRTAGEFRRNLESILETGKNLLTDEPSAGGMTGGMPSGMAGGMYGVMSGVPGGMVSAGMPGNMPGNGMQNYGTMGATARAYPPSFTQGAGYSPYGGQPPVRESVIPSVPAMPAPKPSAQKKSMAPLIVFLTIAVLAILGVAVFFLMKKSDDQEDGSEAKATETVTETQTSELTTEASTKKETVVAEDGTLIGKNYNFKLIKKAITDSVAPMDTSGEYTYYSPREEGKVYIDLQFTVTHTGSGTSDWNDLMRFVSIKPSMDVTVTWFVSSGSEIKEADHTPADPDGSEVVHLALVVPESVRDQNNVSVTINLDGSDCVVNLD